MVASIVLAAAAFVVLVICLRRGAPSFGLPAAYLFNLLLIHLPGALAHASPASIFPDSEATRIGMQFTALGASAFAVGVILARYRRGLLILPSMELDALTGCVLWLAGWFFLLVFVPLLKSIPSVAAAAQTGAAIWILGIVIGVRDAMLQRHSKRFVGWLLLLILYPVFTLLVEGFLGFGVTAAVFCLAPLLVFTRNVLTVFCLTCLLLWGGMSFYISYAVHRTQIRSMVWGGQSLPARLDAAYLMVSSLTWLDLEDPEHLQLIDLRLNQNFLVGLAVQRIRSGDVESLHGQTLVDGVAAMIPRIIWPSKPMMGGSGNVVSQMTGEVFAEGTSVGIGNVMEFYINFGAEGVILGFLALGFCLGRLDLCAATAFRSGELESVIRYFLPALALCQPGGSMVEVAASFAAAVVAAVGWASWYRRWGKGWIDKIRINSIKAVGTVSPKSPVVASEFPFH